MDLSFCKSLKNVDGLSNLTNLLTLNLVYSKIKNIDGLINLTKINPNVKIEFIGAESNGKMLNSYFEKDKKIKSSVDTQESSVDTQESSLKYYNFTHNKIKFSFVDLTSLPKFKFEDSDESLGFVVEEIIYKTKTEYVYKICVLNDSDYEILEHGSSFFLNESVFIKETYQKDEEVINSYHRGEYPINEYNDVFTEHIKEFNITDTDAYYFPNLNISDIKKVSNSDVEIIID